MNVLAQILAYAGATWKRRHFWIATAKYDLHMRYHGSILGIAWCLVHPLAMSAILCVAFHSIFGVRWQEYVPFLLCGTTTWSFISSLFFEGAGSLRNSERYLRISTVPIAVYSLRMLCYLFFHYLITLTACLFFCWVLVGWGNLSALPVLLPALAIFLLFGWAVVTIVGIFDVYVPDSKHVLQVVLQALFYVSPVLYPLSAIQNQTVRTLMNCNPLASFILLIRQPLVEGTVPALSVWLPALLTTMVLVVFAGLLIRKTEKYLVFRL